MEFGQLDRSNSTVSNYFQNYSDETFVVDDDHSPFLKKSIQIFFFYSLDVPVLHFITLPFPKFWHTFDDNDSIICPQAIQNILKILKTYIIEEFELLT